MLALVAFVPNAVATTGVMAVPPAAPPIASVVNVWLALACCFSVLAPASVAFFSMSALVVFVAMLTATEAPTPVALPPPLCFALAFAVFEVAELADSVTLAPFTLTFAPSPMVASA